MSVQEIIREVEKLSNKERAELRQALDAMSQSKEEKPHRLSELRGLGADVWQGLDVEAYLDELRADKDDTDEFS